MSTVGFFFLSLLALVIASGIWQMMRQRKRRKSLHQGPDGQWYWIDFDGSERSAAIHPMEKGGDWYTEPGSSSDGSDGDGGGD